MEPREGTVAAVIAGRPEQCRIMRVTSTEHEEALMANKSAHKEDRKKQASSLKEKRAAKKAKHAKPASVIPPTGH
jgi:hypothetical protein